VDARAGLRQHTLVKTAGFSSTAVRSNRAAVAAVALASALAAVALALAKQILQSLV
jgi:hypothetical protein